MWPIRSALFVPAHRRDWVAKAIRVSPGAVVLDIEDSVPPQFKPQAMEHLKSEIQELRDAGVGAFVRIQPLHRRHRGRNRRRGDRRPDRDRAAESRHTGRNPPPARPAELRRGPRRPRRTAASASCRCRKPRRACTTPTIWPRPAPRVRGIHGALSGPVSGDFARAFGFRATTGGEEQLYLASKLVLDSRAGGAMYPIAGIFGTRAGRPAGGRAADPQGARHRLYRRRGDAPHPRRDRQRRVSADRRRKSPTSQACWRPSRPPRKPGSAPSATRARWSTTPCCRWRASSRRRGAEPVESRLIYADS